MERIVASLKKRYPKKDVAELRAVATDIHYSGEEEAILANDILVDKLFSKWKDKRKEAEAAQKFSHEAVGVCPICKVGMKPINLSEDRKAIWCSKHFVVLPVKSEESTASVRLGQRGTQAATYVSPNGDFGEVQGKKVVRYAFFTDIRVEEGDPRVVWAQLETDTGELVEDRPEQILTPEIRKTLGSRFNLPTRMLESLRR